GGLFLLRRDDGFLRALHLSILLARLMLRQIRARGAVLFLLDFRRRARFGGEQLRDIPAPLLGQRDQLALVFAVAGAARKLLLVVLLEALHDALRAVFLVAQRGQGAQRRLERRAEELANRRHAQLGIFVGVGAAAGPGDERELRKALAHALHHRH